MKYYDKNNTRIVEVNKGVNSAYWDKQWQSEPDVSYSKKVSPLNYVYRFTKKYCPPGSKILEGGCGRADKVYTLHYNGYDVYGLDYAKKAISVAHNKCPELKLSIGDVYSLPFKTNSFDAYWSLGVIEHFIDGYKPIIEEMKRVLKKDGILFVSVPIMSKLRIWKARNNYYPIISREESDFNKEFYQYIYHPKDLLNNYNDYGFKLLEVIHIDGVKGLKDEVSSLKKVLSIIYNHPAKPVKAFKVLLDILLCFFSNHSCLFIFKNTDVGNQF